LEESFLFYTLFKISILLHLSGTKPVNLPKNALHMAKIRDFSNKKSENPKKGQNFVDVNVGCMV
jgi:hypothetical protein